MASRILIIACGNPLRSDDAVAWRASEALQGKFPPDQVEILRVHQLAPELAESMSATQCVIFLDAATAESDDMKAGQIRIEQIRCDKGSGASGFCHAFSPTNVLELAKQLYGASPQAYVVSVIGANFSHGESLSTTVESCLPEFIARIEGLIRECLGRTGDF